MKYKAMLCGIMVLFACRTSAANLSNTAVNAPLVTKAIQTEMTPDQALDRLMAGNERFVKRHRALQQDYIEKAVQTAGGQYPAAIVLSCIDARVPPEIVFDQGVGNLFVTRVAANVLGDDILAGMEYATAIAGAKLIVVLGHDNCGAVTGACKDVKLGHLTSLLEKIKPAMKDAAGEMKTRDCADATFIDRIALENVADVVRAIPKRSPVIGKLVSEGSVKIVGVMYHLSTGKVSIIEK
jgi:carbonic anhydrase